MVLQVLAEAEEVLPDPVLVPVVLVHHEEAFAVVHVVHLVQDLDLPSNVVALADLLLDLLIFSKDSSWAVHVVHEDQKDGHVGVVHVVRGVVEVQNLELQLKALQNLGKVLVVGIVVVAEDCLDPEWNKVWSSLVQLCHLES